MSYKILCIDGGGIRGVFALEILKMIQEELGKDVLEQFDCFSGTSTGALIVSALLKGYHPNELSHFYSLFGRKIFPKGRKGVTWEAKYNQNFLRRILHLTWSEKTTLADLKKQIIIPACRLHGSFDVEIYDNFDLEKAKEWRLVDIALRSSAAPVYFPSYQRYIDGGIYAINPSLLAFSRVIDPKGGNKNISDIKILSIGTGINPTSINEEINWGANDWMSPYNEMADYPLVSLMTEIGATIPDYPLKQMLKNNYLRINATLPIPVEIDDPTKISVLKEAARIIKEKSPQMWNQYINWITSI